MNQQEKRPTYGTFDCTVCADHLVEVQKQAINLLDSDGPYCVVSFMTGELRTKAKEHRCHKECLEEGHHHIPPTAGVWTDPKHCRRWIAAVVVQTERTIENISSL